MSLKRAEHLMQFRLQFRIFLIYLLITELVNM